MPLLRRLPTRHRRSSTKHFDPKAFLASAGIGRTLHRYRPKRAVFKRAVDSAIRADSKEMGQSGRRMLLCNKPLMSFSRVKCGASWRDGAPLPSVDEEPGLSFIMAS
jgi:hypothetical protein